MYALVGVECVIESGKSSAGLYCVLLQLLRSPLLCVFSAMPEDNVKIPATDTEVYSS